MRIPITGVFDKQATVLLLEDISEKSSNENVEKPSK